MNGPTICFCAAGKARRTSKPPRSRARGTITCSMASHDRGSPGLGSWEGSQLMGCPFSEMSVDHKLALTSRLTVLCGGCGLLGQQLDCIREMLISDVIGTPRQTNVVRLAQHVRV